MARTVINVFTVGQNEAVAVTPTALNATDDMNILFDSDNISLVISNTTVSAKTLTFKGYNGNSDYVVSCPASSTVAIGNIESYRFKKADATLDADQYMAMQISYGGCRVKNTTFAISGSSVGVNALYSIDVGAAGSEITGNTFVMSNAGSSGAVSVYYEGYAGHILSRNTFSNGVAITGGAVLDEVKGNTFAATKGFGLGECTIGGMHYHEANPTLLAAIKAYLVAEGNVTTGGTLVVEGYFE